MEKIVIKDFLIFKDIEMPINKFNILIGPQASGKSLLAKLVYFFKNISNLMKSGFENERSFEGFLDKIEYEFLDFFPSQYWNKETKFSIKYSFQNVEVIVRSDFRRKQNIAITFSENITDFYYDCLESIVKHKEDLLLEQGLNDEAEYLSNHKLVINHSINKKILDSDFSDFFEKSIFIPSSRSFFSALNKNIWTLTDQDIIDVDPFVSRFGRAYEQAKMFYNILQDKDGRIHKDFFQEDDSSLSYFKKIIKGDYLKIDDKDWIHGKDYKVNLSRASSGQQESLPMLMVLMINANHKLGNMKSFFIEEPEAHLFPDAQNEVMSLLLNLYDKQQVGFFITTHSPYLIASLNNSIYANELIKKGKLAADDFVKLSEGSNPIDLDHISAFAVEDGSIANIIDYDYMMIGGYTLDNVSNSFEKVMDRLMELDN